MHSFSKSELSKVDATILASTTNQWRKSARVIGIVMTELGAEYKGVPDTFYFERINKMVEDGLLLAQGNLSEMQSSEICNASSEET